MSMKEFASGMQSAVTDRPVVDQTGLTGRYDFTLKWTPDDSQFAQFRGTNCPQPPAGDNPNAPPSLYTAMQETSGLKIHRDQGHGRRDRDRPYREAVGELAGAGPKKSERRQRIYSAF